MAFLEILGELESIWNAHQRHVNVPEHRANLISYYIKPIHFALYWTGSFAWQLAVAEIFQVLARNVIKPANTGLAASVVLVAKKDCALRSCVDHRKLDDVTNHNSFTISRMDECIDNLEDATVLSTLDASSAYWHIKVDERDRHETVFTFHHVFYRFMMMPVDLLSARATSW